MYNITRNIQTQGDFGVHVSNAEADGLIALVKPEIDIQSAYDTLRRGQIGMVSIGGTDAAGRPSPVYEVEAAVMMDGLRFRFTPLHPDGMQLHERVEKLILNPQ